MIKAVHSFEENVICPYCNEEQDISGWTFYDSGKEKVICQNENCEKDFMVETCIVIEYSTWTMEIQRESDEKLWRWRFRNYNHMWG